MPRTMALSDLDALLHLGSVLQPIYYHQCDPPLSHMLNQDRKMLYDTEDVKEDPTNSKP